MSEDGPFYLLMRSLRAAPSYVNPLRELDKYLRSREREVNARRGRARTKDVHALVQEVAELDFEREIDRADSEVRAREAYMVRVIQRLRSARTRATDRADDPALVGM